MSIRGLSFVLTGKMSRNRDEIVAAIQNAGGYYADKDVRGCDYVVVGKRVGMTKLDGAQRYGKPFITENELMRLIRGDITTARAITRDQVILYTNDQFFTESTLYSDGAAAAARSTINNARTAPAQPAPPQTPVEGFSISDFFTE